MNKIKLFFLVISLFFYGFSVNLFPAFANREPDLFKITQGTVGEINGYSIGVINGGPQVQLAVWPVFKEQQDANDWVIKIEASRGDLILLQDKFFRVFYTATSAIAFETNPISIPKNITTPKNWVVPLHASGELHKVEFEVEKIFLSTKDSETKKNWIAQVAMWPNNLMKKEADSQKKISYQQVKVGDLFMLAGKKHRVIRISPPQPNLSLPGWIELSWNIYP